MVVKLILSTFAPRILYPVLESGNQREENFGEAGKAREIWERIIPTQTGSSSINFGYLCAHITSNCLVTEISFRPQWIILGCVTA